MHPFAPGPGLSVNATTSLDRTSGLPARSGGQHPQRAQQHRQALGCGHQPRPYTGAPSFLSERGDQGPACAATGGSSVNPAHSSAEIASALIALAQSHFRRGTHQTGKWQRSGSGVWVAHGVSMHGFLLNLRFCPTNALSCFPAC